MGYAKENGRDISRNFLMRVSADVAGIRYLKEKLGEYLAGGDCTEYGTDHVTVWKRQKSANLI